MAILLIGKLERAKAQQLIELARKSPVPISVVRDGVIDETDVLTLEQRLKARPDFIRPESMHMTFPGGYRAAISFEEQPIGMCSHLSISVEGRAKPGMMPSPEAVEIIAKVFEVPFPPARSWIEEYEKGEFAINLVSPTGEVRQGHA